MAKNSPIILPQIRRLLEELGNNIRAARLRRRFSAEQVAERANISRKTLYFIESGSPSVSIGAFINVLKVLGLHEQIKEVAKDDVLGRKLQDAGLPHQSRAPKKRK